MKNKVGIISLGCPKNLVDSEIMIGLLNRARFEITNNIQDAEILIINTCGFIESAKKESIDAILEAAEYKKRKCRLLIATGCLVERYKTDLLNAVPELDIIIGTGGYAEIANAIKSYLPGKKREVYPELNNVSYLNNKRELSSEKGHAYIKISEGCDNRCSYCIIPSIRGPYRSRELSEIEKEARSLAKQGKKEIILISQDTTRYGSDLYNKKSLVKLIKRLSTIKDIKWIRLLYCYPDEIDDDLIREFAINEKLCKYIDMPIQHASDKILKAMSRRTSGKYLNGLIAKIKQNIPEIIVRTSVIVGFPGETNADFEILYDFIRQHEFDRLGIFLYSREEGTKAASMKGQVKKSIKESRYLKLIELQNSINIIKNKKRIGKENEIIVDCKTKNNVYFGRTYGEAPEIDWNVYFKSPKLLATGDIVKARILRIK